MTANVHVEEAAGSRAEGGNGLAKAAGSGATAYAGEEEHS